MKYFSILIILAITSCTNDTQKITSLGKFIGNQEIDTTLYNTYDDLAIQKKIIKISTSDSLANDIGTSFRLPLVSTDKYVFIAKKCMTDYGKQVFLRLNKDGDIQDSIIVNKNVVIFDDFIIDDDFYYSWFLDNNIAMKKIKSINYSDVDSLKLKDLIIEINKNKTPFTKGYDFYDKTGTENYLITFANNNLVKYYYSANLSKKYSNRLLLDYNDDNKAYKKTKDLGSIKSDNLFKVDNFFAETYNEFIEGNSIKGFNPTGGSSDSDKYVGTYFFTLSNKANLKLKINNEELRKSNNISDFAKYQEVYTEDLLNFYLINVNFQDWKNPVFYVIPK